jgi:hypothetical protein
LVAGHDIRASRIGKDFRSATGYRASFLRDKEAGERLGGGIVAGVDGRGLTDRTDRTDLMRSCEDAKGGGERGK